eukprot:jgi/Bigna1/146820/aug1.121_g21528
MKSLSSDRIRTGNEMGWDMATRKKVLLDEKNIAVTSETEKSLLAMQSLKASISALSFIMGSSAPTPMRQQTSTFNKRTYARSSSGSSLLSEQIKSVDLSNYFLNDYHGGRREKALVSVAARYADKMGDRLKLMRDPGSPIFHGTSTKPCERIYSHLVVAAFLFLSPFLSLLVVPTLASFSRPLHEYVLKHPAFHPP